MACRRDGASALHRRRSRDSCTPDRQEAGRSQGTTPGRPPTAAGPALEALPNHVYKHPRKSRRNQKQTRRASDKHSHLIFLYGVAAARPRPAVAPPRAPLLCGQAAVLGGALCAPSGRRLLFAPRSQSQPRGRWTPFVPAVLGRRRAVRRSASPEQRPAEPPSLARSALGRPRTGAGRGRSASAAWGTLLLRSAARFSPMRAASAAGNVARCQRSAAAIVGSNAGTRLLGCFRVLPSVSSPALLPSYPLPSFIAARIHPAARRSFQVGGGGGGGEQRSSLRSLVGPRSAPIVSWLDIRTDTIVILET